MNKIKVLVADDHAIVRIGLKSVLDYETDIEVVGEAKNGIEAVQEAERTQPDVIIMDLVMPRKDGVSATREIHDRLPDTKILILTTFGTSDGIAHALEEGASGAMMKTADDEKIVSAIRRIARGETYISPDIRRQLEENPPVPKLSPRQTEVLTMIANGKSNKEIAAQLGIRIDSVEDIANALYAKLSVSNRAEAVDVAHRKHLLKI
ncbi:MAG: response regulator transcription factor [Kiritimatiellae bacterium]|nr:response regulator transcription factor [Kiritimatiellia bacterium]